MLLANVYVGFIRLCYGGGGDERVLEILGAPRDSVFMEVLALLVCSLLSQDLGYAGVRIAGHALWAEVGGGIIFVVLWEFSGFFINALGKSGKVVHTTLV